MKFVQANKLEPGMVLAKNIIGMKRRGMMLSKGMTLNESYIAHIQQHGYLGAYVVDEMSKEVEAQDVIDEQLFSEGIEAVFQADVGALTNVATKMVQQISQKKSLRVDLFDLRSYDDYTYHHSVNVAVYASVIGRKLGLSHEDLELLSMAALSHDLGKSKIPEMILNKPGRLDEEEYDAIKKHSQFSYDVLTEDHHVIPARVRMAVLFHHENEDGSGYPNGLTGESIPLFAKIIHAVDVFDALTSKRPYKQPYSPAEAYEYMLSFKGKLFDENVVNQMMTCIPAYPPGLDVTLSNGKEALVVGNTIHAMRPVVKLYETGEIVNLYTDAEYTNITIIASGIMQADYAQPEAAEVVKLIFELTAQGKSKTEVANYLNAQGIDTPSAYKKRKGSRNFFHAVEVKSLWSTSSIRDILNDEVYLGKLIWNKTKKRIGSNNTSSYVPKDEWMVIENCHEPIITQELFDMAHANSKKCVRSKRGKRNYNPFYYCGVCGRALAPSKRVKGDILLCYSSRIEENSPCKSNRVEIAKVEDAIMKTVNMYATVYLDEKGIKRSGKSKEVSPEEKLAALEKKVKSLSSKKMMLYSDYKDDKLTREEYVKRSKAMVEQIDELHQEIEQLKSELPTEDNSAGKFETQLENIINMESFDREKIQKVIKKVIINGEDNIEIVWNTDDPFFK